MNEGFVLSQDLLDIVTKLAVEKGVSREEIIKQAITMYAYFQTEVADKPNQKLSITSSDTDDVLSDIELA